MANRRTHTGAGAIVGGAANLAWQLHRIYAAPEPPATVWEAISQVNFFEVGLFALVGGFIFGCLPDILEPATSPNHRGFFHSVTCGGGVLYGAFGEHSERWPENDRAAARSMALSYISHLYFDAGTPKGLPFS